MTEIKDLSAMELLRRLKEENDIIVAEYKKDNERLRVALTALLERHVLYCGGKELPFAGHTDKALFEYARTALQEKVDPDECIRELLGENND